MADAALPWLRLIRSHAVGNAAALVLVRHFGDAQTTLDSSGSAWRKAGVERTPTSLIAEDDPEVLADLAWLRGAANRQLVSINDPRYPAELVNINNPPLALFVVGKTELLAQPQVAIVGSRAATPQGLENARAFAAELARRGVIVTSGLALGVDGAAHQGALDGGGATIAVCGTGLDRVYPARHKALAHVLVEQGGALVSEFAPRTAAVASHFPRRNRVISGLSLGVLVVEASRDSGSLITARLAADQGREVFAIPGSIHNPLSKGCHQLIRQGAKLVESVDDILLELAPRLGAWLREAKAAEAPVYSTAADDPATATLFAALTDAPRSVDSLIAQTGLPAEAINTALLTLELDGRAGATAGGGYMRLR